MCNVSFQTVVLLKVLHATLTPIVPKENVNVAVAIKETERYVKVGKMLK